MENVFFMKCLVPGGKGGFTVHRFAKNTDNGAEALRDQLLAAGDWSDASQTEWDNFDSASKAVGEIASNLAEWARIEDLSDESKKAIRTAVQEGSEVVLA